MKNFYLLMSFTLLLGLSNVNAQIYGYGNDLLGVPAVIDPNASGSNLSRVNGALSLVACADGFNSRSFPSTTVYAPGLAAIQWSITPDAGYEVNVTSISTKQRRNSSGPARIRFAYSLDGTNWIDQGSNQTLPTASCGSSTTLSWNMADFTHPSTVYFRAYGFNAASLSGQHQIFDVLVSGSVTLIIVPGCTEASACNYNPSANIDDGSCIYPGCNNPSACNFDPAAGCDDGSCVLFGDSCDDGDPTTSSDFIQLDCNCIGYPDNDDRSAAIPVVLTPMGECIPFVANLLLASNSPESQTSATTGEDIWYSFVAYTNAVNLEISSGSFDGIIELQDNLGNLLDSDDVTLGVGSEILNYDGLTEGATYYVSLRNMDSGMGGAGFVDICLNYIKDSNLENIPLVYNPCDNAKSRFVGAYSHQYFVTSQTTLVTTTYTRIGNTYFQPRNIPGVTYNDTYDVDVDPTYHLFDAAGNPETIVVTTDNIDVMPIGTQALMSPRVIDQCGAGPNLLGSIVAGEPFVCMSTDYEWEFTRTDIPAAPINHLRGAANRFLVLSTVPGLVLGATYDVRIRPIFSYGAGNWGPVTCMSIAGPGPMVLQNGDNDQPYFEVSQKEQSVELTPNVSLNLFPNPNNGESFMLELNNLEVDEILTVSIVDLNGKVVISEQVLSSAIAGSPFVLDRPLTAGVYNVMVSGKNYNDNQLMVVE